MFEEFVMNHPKIFVLLPVIVTFVVAVFLFLMGLCGFFDPNNEEMQLWRDRHD